MPTFDADAIIAGAGLSGLAAAAALVAAGKKIIITDQEGEQSLGGQAFWSFGGLFFVNSPEQRIMGIRDSIDLSRRDWMGTAAFDRPEDNWPRQWAEAYLQFAAGEKRAWLHSLGMRFFPVVGWAERGGYLAGGPGNSVPRFHITWGTGPGVLAPFISIVRDGQRKGLVQFRFRHRITQLLLRNGIAEGVAGDILQEDTAARGVKSTRNIKGSFELKAPAVIICSGGIGANAALVRKNWPARLGPAPQQMLCGVPDHVDGALLEITATAGGHIINPDRMWHYTEGIRNWDPVWSNHGIRILPGPSSLWLDASGNRLPAPLFPGFDTLGTLQHILGTGKDYSWFILNQKIIRKEFALSGSEQNPDLTGKSWKKVLGRAFGKTATPPVEAFKEKGADFIVKDKLEDLVAAMNALTGESLLDYHHIKEQIAARDGQIINKFGKDMQVNAIRAARKYLGDRFIRTAPLHALLDPEAGPLIAVKLHILTRKTLGGLETDLSSRVLNAEGQPIPGLFAAGEAAGFGGGGMHGYRALEGTFLGGCIFSGKTAGSSAAKM